MNCYKCLDYESGDSAVGINSGCTSEVLYDDNGQLKPDWEEILDYLFTEKECPYFRSK